MIHTQYSTVFEIRTIDTILQHGVLDLDMRDPSDRGVLAFFGFENGARVIFEDARTGQSLAAMQIMAERREVDMYTDYTPGRKACYRIYFRPMHAVRSNSVYAIDRAMAEALLSGNMFQFLYDNPRIMEQLEGEPGQAIIRDWLWGTDPAAERDFIEIIENYRQRIHYEHLYSQEG